MLSDEDLFVSFRVGYNKRADDDNEDSDLSHLKAQIAGLRAAAAAVLEDLAVSTFESHAIVDDEYQPKQREKYSYTDRMWINKIAAKYRAS